MHGVVVPTSVAGGRRGAADSSSSTLMVSGGDAVSLPDVTTSESAAALPDLVVTCRVCQRAYAKYTCPRCFTRYCALSCYKTHNGRCVESFHGDNLSDAMKGLTVEDEEKKRMTEILAKYARQDDDDDDDDDDTGGNLDDDDDEDDDDLENDEEDGLGERSYDGTRVKGGKDGIASTTTGRCVLSEAVLEKLSRGEELTPEDLTPRELAAFERAAAAGELSHMVEPWTAWWTIPEARDIVLAPDGSTMIEVMDDEEEQENVVVEVEEEEEEKEESVSSGAVTLRRKKSGGAGVGVGVGVSAVVPRPPDEPLPPLSRLSPVKPSDALRWHLLDVLGAYTLTMRAHDGDWGAEPIAALDALVSLSAVLAAGTQKNKPSPPAAQSQQTQTTGEGRTQSGSNEDVSIIGGGGVRHQLPGTASAALYGVASRAAALPSGVMAAAAAGAAAGAMLEDVHSILRGGRGCVVLALTDVHRMVRAAAAEIKKFEAARRVVHHDGVKRGVVVDGEMENGKRHGSVAESREGHTHEAGDGGEGEGGGGGEVGRVVVWTGLWKQRGALSRLERKVYFLLCWANGLVEREQRRRQRRRRRRRISGDGAREVTPLSEQSVDDVPHDDDDEDKKARSLVSVIEDDDEGEGEYVGVGENGTFELLRRRIEREMRAHANGRSNTQHPLYRRTTMERGGGGGGGGGVDGGGSVVGGGAGGATPFSLNPGGVQTPRSRQLVVEL